VARGTRDTKIQVIEVSVSSLYISSLCQNIVYKIVFYTFKGALDHTTIKLYSMANIERATKAAL
jgi:hypothetical protein